jgi:VWFA-related protein
MNVFALAILASAALYAQQAASPKISVTTRAVQISAVVTDSQGKPVSGLKLEDFELFDKGKPQRIAEVSEETRSSEAPPKLQPGLFTNYWALSSSNMTPASTVILIDTLNTAAGDQQYAREQVLRFLEGIRSTDRVAIYWLGSQLRVIQEFTSDPEALVRTVRSLRQNPSRELDGSTTATDLSAFEGDPELAQLIRSMYAAEQNMRDFFTLQRIRLTLTAMEAIGRHVGRLPGRKNLIWVSGSFPLQIGLDDYGESWKSNPARERRAFTNLIDRTTRLFNDSNIAIYPVDARGLTISPTFSTAANIPGRPGPPASAMSPIADTNNSVHSMNTLAGGTGGRAFVNRNDITNAIREALDETAITYMLTYYPDHNEWTGSWRKVEVKLRDREGLAIRHRSGYAALGNAPQSKDQEAERKREVQEVIESALEATEVVLVSYLSRNSENEVDVLLRVFPYSLTLTRGAGGKWVGAVEVFYALEGAADNPDSKVIQTSHDISLTPQQLEDLKTHGLQLRRRFTLPKQIERMKVVVRDKTTGRIGSLALPLEGLPRTSPNQ